MTYVRDEVRPAPQPAFAAQSRWFVPAWPLLAALGAALFFAFKLLRVARGDSTVALAIAQASDKPAAFAGILVELVPFLLLLVWAAGAFVVASSFASVARAAEDQAERAGLRGLRLLVGGTVALAVSGWLLLAVPGWPNVLVAAAILLAAVGREYWHWRRGGQSAQMPPAWMTRSVSHLAGGLVAVVLVAGLLLMDSIFTGALSDQMWLPAHRLVVRGGGQIVGYELDRGYGTVTVLRERDRTIVLVPVRRVASDEVCELGGVADTRSAWDAVSHLPRPHIPRCDASSAD